MLRVQERWRWSLVKQADGGMCSEAPRKDAAHGRKTALWTQADGSRVQRCAPCMCDVAMMGVKVGVWWEYQHLGL